MRRFLVFGVAARLIRNRLWVSLTTLRESELAALSGEGVPCAIFVRDDQIVDLSGVDLVEDDGARLVGEVDLPGQGGPIGCCDLDHELEGAFVFCLVGGRARLYPGVRLVWGLMRVADE